VGVENIDDLFLLRVSDTSAMEREIDSSYLKKLKNRIDKVIADQNALHVTDLKIDGQDVMKTLNIGPGPKVGSVLNWLLEKVLDDPKLNKREDLIKLIKEYEAK
jgi:tRNA nucleotidyltransferase (CCA-adding enzyme)